MTEPESRKWLARALLAYLEWALILGAVAGIQEAGGATTIPVLLLILAILVIVIFTISAGRAIQRIGLPRGRALFALGRLLYLAYPYSLLVIAVSSLPFFIGLGFLEGYPALSALKVASGGATFLGLLSLVAFVLWHRSLLRVYSAPAEEDR